MTTRPHSIVPTAGTARQAAPLWTGFNVYPTCKAAAKLWNPVPRLHAQNYPKECPLVEPFLAAAA